MIVYIFLAFLNGMVIGTSRSMNGRLSTEIGPLKASLWNHIVGFLFLTLLLLIIGAWKFHVTLAPQFFSYLGGFCGALFVAVNSYVFPRLGAMKAVLLVISGEMFAAVFMDYRNQHAAPTAARCLGVVIVLAGVYLSRSVKSSRDRERAHND